MFYALMKLMYALYFLGVAWFTFKSVSDVVYSLVSSKAKLLRTGKAVVFGVFWPLSLLSANGRKRLSYYIKGA